jgi:demethoxyubiquinone hydroxylase (CLK1/Coq7/Cat5 family)
VGQEGVTRHPAGSTPAGGPVASGALLVLYDGACPLCAREIAHYAGLSPVAPVHFRDVAAAPEGDLGCGIERDIALARMHVVEPDGTVRSGARAFIALWKRMPGWRWLGRLASVPPMPWLLEIAYRAFLRVRPALQARARRAVDPVRWLERELRSDHAGESGAVMIYRGILAVSRDAAVRAFAQRHLQTEQRHLAAMETLVPPASRTRLLPAWRLAGFLTGALPALASPQVVYATIAAVETFVDRHYLQQIERLPVDGEGGSLRAQLESFRHDELEHRDEAAALAAVRRGPLLRAWAAVVEAGSAAAVVVARRI